LAYQELFHEKKVFDDGIDCGDCKDDDDLDKCLNDLHKLLKSEG